MKTLEVELPSSGRKVTIRRPVFSLMTNAAREYERLLELDGPGQMMADPAFQRVLVNAFEDETKANDFLKDADFEEAWELWLAYNEFSRFEEFLGKASEALMEKKTALMRKKMASQGKQIEAMKSLGLVPADFSIAAAMRAHTSELFAGSADGSPTSDENELPVTETTSTTPSSTTTTPASTAGSPAKSTRKTTGR